MKKSSVISSIPWKPDDKCLSLLWKGSLLAFLISFYQEPPCIWYKLILYSFTMSNAIMMLTVSSGLYTCFTDYYLPWINYTDKSANNANTCKKFYLWIIITAVTLSGSWRHSFIQMLHGEGFIHAHISGRGIWLLTFKMFLRYSFSGL